MAANIFGSDASWVSPTLLFIVIEIPLKASLLRDELLWTREWLDMGKILPRLFYRATL